MTQIFINRAELMPVGETTENHKEWQKEEAFAVDKDRKSVGDPCGGLFGGCFASSSRRNGPPIIDFEDGIDRCPRCTWELEDGVCASCDYEVGVTFSGLSGSESPSVSYYTEDEMAQEYFRSQRGEIFDDDHRRRLVEQNFAANGRISSDSDEDAIAIASERAVLRRRFRARERTVASPPGRFHYPGINGAYPDIATDDDEFGDSDDYSAEDEEAGSLDGFVVDDMDEQTSSIVNSPRSSHYDTDEVTGVIEEFRTYSSEDEQHAREDHHGNDHPVQITEERTFESDTDDDPITRAGRHDFQRSADSPKPSSSDGSEVITIADRYNHSHGSRREQNHEASTNPQTASRPSTANNAAGLGSRNGSRGVLIEIGSDSDSPPVVPRPRRRRALPPRILSDDDDDATNASADAHPGPSRPSSSGTATIGQPSPSRSSVRDGDLQQPNQIFSAISPIVITSSPNRPHVPRYGWSPYHQSAASPDRVSRAPRPSIARSGNERNTRQHALMARHRQHRQNQPQSPRQPNTQPSSIQAPRMLLSSLVADSPRADPRERVRLLTLERAARKAERQQAKQDRRRRELERTIASGSSRQPTSLDGSEMMNLDGGVEFVDQD